MYADIIVDISHEKLDKVFQYAIPEKLLSQIKIGSQVEMPFGMGNRLIKGYVVGISHKADYPVDKIKNVENVLKDSTTIETQLIQLAWWIRENYGSTMIQALKTVIPIKRKIHSTKKRYIKLLLSKEEAALLLEEYKHKKYTARARVLEELIKESQWSYEIISKKLNISASTIKDLEKLKIIEVTSEDILRNPNVYNVKTEEYNLELNQEQKYVVERILEDYKRNIASTYLVHGVTGSGKTEVYMELIAEVIKDGKQAIVLIPEIALTYQTIFRFYKRFGERVSIINSKLSAGERFDQFRRAKTGGIDIMIGPRSALFTPFSNLGVIIIDEEHEGSYKSETTPKYHARETSIERARLAGAFVVLGSATPSIESYHNTLIGNYTLLTLKERINKSPLPEVHTVDLREELKEGNRTIFSRKLRELIEDRLNKKQQIILFINRRGYAGFVSCRACGKPLKCPHCDVSLTSHNNGKLMCHYCGYQISMPKQCPSCSSPYIAAFGLGTQKVEEAVRKSFPKARVLRMDMDTTKNKDGHEKILSTFANHEADILIGTQMIVKGHDFPLVTLVGVIAADLSLYANDYRAAERTFQLLTQAAGRAGRGNYEGEVVIQTYSPEHYSIETAAKQDYINFYNQEMLYRRLLNYPPVANMLMILITCADYEYCDKLAVLIHTRIVKKYETMNFQVIGPSDAGIAKINDIYRKVIYLKHVSYDYLTQIKDDIEIFIKENPVEKETLVQFDFNPMNIY